MLQVRVLLGVPPIEPSQESTLCFLGCVLKVRGGGIGIPLLEDLLIMRQFQDSIVSEVTLAVFRWMCFDICRFESGPGEQRTVTGRLSNV